jgi:hypothetical protein
MVNGGALRQQPNTPYLELATVGDDRQATTPEAIIHAVTTAGDRVLLLKIRQKLIKQLV